MIPRVDYVRQSLETHLFFARIMKEHSFFLAIGFTPRDSKYTQRAQELQAAFSDLLGEVIMLSDGIVSPDLLDSGEVITQYTLNAEKLTEFYTGISLSTQLTESVAELGCGYNDFRQGIERRVSEVNNHALRLLEEIIQFKTNVLKNVLECRMFTVNYPLLIEHILREAHLYQYLIRKLQNREDIHRDAFEQEHFWNQIMAEHSKFIRGLLDPTEEELFRAANNFGNEFDQLTREAKEAMDMNRPFNSHVTEESLHATMKLRDFKAQGTEGIINGKIRSIIIPLLGDHTLREANHYLRLLRIFEQ